MKWASDLRRNRCHRPPHGGDRPGRRQPGRRDVLPHRSSYAGVNAEFHEVFGGCAGPAGGSGSGPVVNAPSHPFACPTVGARRSAPGRSPSLPRAVPDAPGVRPESALPRQQGGATSPPLPGPESAGASRRLRRAARLGPAVRRGRSGRARWHCPGGAGNSATACSARPPWLRIQHRSVTLESVGLAGDGCEVLQTRGAMTIGVYEDDCSGTSYLLQILETARPADPRRSLPGRDRPGRLSAGMARAELGVTLFDTAERYRWGGGEKLQRQRPGAASGGLP